MKQRMIRIRNRWKKADRIERVGVLLTVGAILFLIIVLIWKKVSFAREQKRLEREVAAGPRVEVATVEKSAPERLLTLIGEARPYESVTLYAKVSGFLKHVRVDKGDRVTKGTLLATVESPESNEDYEAAVADAENKRAIADRYKPLLERKLVSQQEAEQSFSDAAVAEAKVRSLGAVKGYQEIRAPFDGMVTARFADPGALVQNAANSQTSAQPLFVVSQIEKLRIYVYVDQRDAAAIKRGLPVTIGLDERPEVKIGATVTRFSGELDARTRMLLAEVDVDNKNGQLVAGSFVKVSTKVQTPSYLQVPVEALILKEAKNYVPVISSSQTLHYQPVELADNDGEHVRVLQGLEQGEQVALSLGNSLPEGARVQPIQIAKAPTPQPANGAQTASPQGEASQKASSSTATSPDTDRGSTAPSSSAPVTGNSSK
jgi:membrane fusion protein, multidrug efflux system